MVHGQMMNPVPSKRILVVDDEPLVCDSVRMLLVWAGHKVETALSGAEALAKFESQTFDLVFTDFKMPQMNGEQLAHAIKERDPLKPVIMLTAFPPKQKPPAVDVVVLKPFTLERLCEAISRVAA